MQSNYYYMVQKSFLSLWYVNRSTIFQPQYIQADIDRTSGYPIVKLIRTVPLTELAQKKTNQPTNQPNPNKALGIEENLLTV